jgi:hypothetical protein
VGYKKKQLIFNSGFGRSTKAEFVTREGEHLK